VGVSPAPKTDL